MTTNNKYVAIDANQDNGALGEISVSTNVLEVLLGTAASKVAGVYGMRGTLANNINSLLGRQNRGKGVVVSYGEDRISADVYVYLEYGVSVPKVALALQKELNQQLEYMTDMKLADVNIHVVGLVAQKISSQQMSTKIN
ncbi:Asp23/Gls24 family envelope stress response protein [Bombilactobacillus thymidiniphilus]|uniref:Asp23/Gls24 family envelope stress response protein n=1 Tax=Bombilactobacillus thymidiniphilus TaxID=2923363 RepID=A0ABY4PCM9_9LACO|nr:Asp23/Gls24 family envelope stress response protein [Bombilactobacillus thymidiniphilus]UQS83447.1 Asp23/Gls24 family envelope stress response protein [Bombilactobacillus thymidiniphilus]